MSQKPTRAQKKALLIKLAVATLLALTGAALVLRGLDLRALMDQTLALMREAGPGIFFAAMAVLPAVGFPISPFWLTAGPVFAGQFGLPVVIACCGAALAANLAITYWLARYALRPPLVWLVRRLGYELPRVARADQAGVTVLIRVTPGPPFCVQGYLLGLAEVRFRTYLAVSWPISMTFGVVFFYFGDSLAQGKGKLALLAFCGLMALGAGLKFLRGRMLRKQAAREEMEPVDTPESLREETR